MEKAGDFRDFWNNKLRKDGWTLYRTSLQATDVELEYIATQLLEWSTEEKPIKASTFHLDRNISFRVWNDWLVRCPELAEAYETVKAKIGERRERKGLEGKYNASIVALTMPLYDRDYKEWKREQMKAASKNDEGKQTIVVVRDRMPDTDEVLPKRVEMAE